MSRLTDFKPLARVDLPILGSLDSSGLILLVGPNSSGKSQLLQDLFHRICGEPRDLVVAHRIDVRKPEDVEPFVELLVSDGYLERYRDSSGKHQLRPLTTYVGTGQSPTLIEVGQPNNWWNTYDAQGVSGISRNEFLNYFGRFLVTALFLDRRLSSFNQCGTFDHQTQPPQNDLHAFWMDDAARDDLIKEVRNTFSKAVWPDQSRGNVLCLKVSDDPDLPTDGQKQSPKIMSKYRTIETEGDGLKSYVATCISLLLGRRPICLIDEPELCLHPPQAYNLGRFIGNFGTSAERATFVATHSSHILRGVIQTAERLQIVRLTHRGQSFQAHLVPSDLLKEMFVKPFARSETVLDGIFAQSVVVLEADGDRAIYQAVFETLSQEFPFDVHFTAVGGTGGIADTCHLYRRLRIPTAVVADLDIVANLAELKRIVLGLADEVSANLILEAAAKVSEQIKNLPPTITSEGARGRLVEIASLGVDWSKDEDAMLHAKLKELAHDLDRMRRLKRGGLSSLPPEISGPVGALVSDLARIGLFVVPVGELEGWLASRQIVVSKRTKWAWASEAASKVRQLGAQPDDVWTFMREVATFVTGGS